jgi:hypothetical protein
MLFSDAGRHASANVLQPDRSWFMTEFSPESPPERTEE